ncbi:L-arabinose isomerase [Clostridia bacterium]|nr:L-arabinose isomerase [Clostridia bacterium]
MKFWFIAGSQFLYGEETLKQVEKDCIEIAAELKLEYKATVKTAEGALSLVKAANFDDECAGVVVFCHTFSPSKMWVSALNLLQKPYLHLHTQYNASIPNDAIDMDYMNLHQSAHGDREHGFIAARLRMPRKIVVGHWKDLAVQAQIADWRRVAVGVAESKNLKVMRFGDNMREVGVTEGDKVEAQLKLGWQVNTWGVGELAATMSAVTDGEIDALVGEYRALYDGEITDTVRYQARAELGMKTLLERENCKAFTNTFEDLFGMEQLPGLATQRLMSQGCGYGGEGDWKVSAMTRIAKAMGGTASFMEDYTYDFDAGLVLGAHMLEVCPSIAADRPKIEVHPLGIGGKEPPARLVFEGKAGAAVCVSLIDLGGRFRLIVQDVECVKPNKEYPNLPVARVMWKPLPDLKIAAEAWLRAGGSHHTVLSYDLRAEQFIDFARIIGIECVHIGAHTNLADLERQLTTEDLIWNLKR